MNKDGADRNPKLGWYTKITFVSNWGYWLELNGRQLEQGEWIEILCPDGSTIKSPVKVERFQDNAVRDPTPDYRFHVQISLWGWENVQLRLREGMLARRIEAPVPTTKKTESPA